MPFRFSAARQRLLVLYLLAAGPLLMLLGIGAYMDRASALRTAMNQAENFARLAAQQQDDMVQEAENLLAVLSLVPEIRALGEGCYPRLRQVDEAHQRISRLAVYRRSGELACSSWIEQASGSVADRSYFQAALAEPDGNAVVSRIFTGRASGRPTMVVARALPASPAGEAPGVISASLNLDSYWKLAATLSGAPGTTVEVVDVETATVLARSRGDTIDILPQPAGEHLVTAMRAKPGGGSIEAPNGGALHAIGFAALPGTAQKLVLAIGIPRSEVVASSNHQITFNVLGFLGATIAAIVLAWLAADRSLLRPIARLGQVAGSIGTGDLAARVGPLPGAVHELKVLGTNFDAMAERLRIRDHSIAAMGRRIADSEEHHRLLTEYSSDMIARFDRRFVRTYLSPASRDVVGYEPDALVGQAIVEVVLQEDRARVHSELVAPLLQGAESARCTYRVVHRSGQHIWLQTSGRRLPDGSGFVTVARDVSIQKVLEAQVEAATQRLRVQAMTDSLTGIANRRRFDEILGFEFRRSQRLQEPLSLLMVDIDHFKSFNDTHGHVIGDECLHAVAVALDRSLRRPGDLVGRYGGEEFAVVLPGTPPSGMAAVAERMRESVRRVTLPGRTLTAQLTVSIGGATMIPPIAASGPAILLEAADAVLYQAKNAGRDTVRTVLVEGEAVHASQTAMV